MIFPLVSATDDPESLADWFEMEALRSKDGRASIADLVRTLRQNGTTDALDESEDAAEYDTDPRSERSEAIAEDAFCDVEERAQACGDAYPFVVNERYIQLRDSGCTLPYTFLLLLSQYGKDAGPSGTDGARLFEDVCSTAAKSYLGGETAQAEARVFGFPRRVLPRGFSAALDKLCQEMGVGGGCKNHPRTKDQKDGKLDIVAWSDFPDRREGKLIGFGQCATGQNWRDKVTELIPEYFCAIWMREIIYPTPVRLFFVPFRVQSSFWRDIGVYGSVLFERCRIAALSQTLDDVTHDSCVDWTRSVINSRVTL